MTTKEILEEIKASITPDQIQKMSIKDRLTLLNTLEEFENPKLMRASYAVDPELPDTIKIEIVTNENT